MEKKYEGLTDIETRNNQEKYGLNEIKQVKRKNFIITLINEFNDWLVIILILAAFISLVVDRNSLFESMIIIMILFINAIIGAIQEIKAHKTLDGLKKISSHKVKVIRNNKVVVIEPIYLTIDDIVLLEKGNIIDADMILLEASEISIDESILTGESINIEKKKNDYIYSGTYLVNGNGIGKVINIGMKSKVGLIANEIINVKEEITPLEEKLAQIGKIIGLIAIFICLIVFVIELLLGISVLEAFKSAVSLAVAAIPEGLTTVVTVCLAIGVRRMAKENAIIKRLACVETLGCSNVVCTDKTGTLTQNKQNVVKIYKNKEYSKEQFNQLDTDFLNYINILSTSENIEIIDPIDIALHDFILNRDFVYKDFNIIKVKPFNSLDKYMRVEVNYQGRKNILYKGAYEQLSNLVRIKPNNSFINIYNDFLENGYRVIAISNEDEILGLIACEDLPRKDVIKTILMANNAGVKTIMITGDHAKTAFSIASQLNITNDIEEVINKDKLDKLTDEELFLNIEKYKVYARVSPMDKVRIVDAWQKKGMIVAMTGDGVNDAPALKKADIGCAMGNGAEISKECADIILVDSNYNTIIKAIKNGRGIYENIKRCCKYLLSSNIGEVLTILIVVLLSLITKIDLGIPLLAIHLLWINVITDSLPAFGLGLLDNSDELMKKKPRDKKEHFFDKNMSLDILFMGTVIGLITVITYFIGLRINNQIAPTMAFFTLSTSQLFHSYNCINDKSIFNEKILKNKFLNISFIIGLLLQFLVIYNSKVNVIFKLKPLKFPILLLCLLMSLLVILFSEIKKSLKTTN